MNAFFLNLGTEKGTEMIPKGSLTFKYLRLKCVSTVGSECFKVRRVNCTGMPSEIALGVTFPVRKGARPAAGIGCASAKQREVQGGRNEPASGLSHVVVYALKQTITKLITIYVILESRSVT